MIRLVGGYASWYRRRDLGGGELGLSGNSRKRRGLKHCAHGSIFPLAARSVQARTEHFSQGDLSGTRNSQSLVGEANHAAGDRLALDVLKARSRKN